MNPRFETRMKYFASSYVNKLKFAYRAIFEYIYSDGGDSALRS